MIHLPTYLESSSKEILEDGGGQSIVILLSAQAGLDQGLSCTHLNCTLLVASTGTTNPGICTTVLSKHKKNSHIVLLVCSDYHYMIPEWSSMYQSCIGSTLDVLSYQQQHQSHYKTVHFVIHKC